MKHLILGLALLGTACVYSTELENDDMAKEEAAGVGGWSASGKLINFNRMKGIKVQAKIAEPGMFTIQFGVTRPPIVSGATDVVRPTADITWAVAGNTTNRRISVVDGLSFSGVGSYPQVKMYDGSIPGQSGVTGLVYSGSILVAPGTRPSQNQPPSLDPVTYINNALAEAVYDGAIVLNPTDFSRFLVPPKSGAISVFVTVSDIDNAGSAPITEADFVIEQRGATTLLSKYSTIDQYVPLAAGCTSVAVINRSAALTEVVSLRWGIDG